VARRRQKKMVAINTGRRKEEEEHVTVINIVNILRAGLFILFTNSDPKCRTCHPDFGVRQTYLYLHCSHDTSELWDLELLNHSYLYQNKTRAWVYLGSKSACLACMKPWLDPCTAKNKTKNKDNSNTCLRVTGIK
jgi:hypothetical protein